MKKTSIAALLMLVLDGCCCHWGPCKETPTTAPCTLPARVYNDVYDFVTATHAEESPLGGLPPSDGQTVEPMTFHDGPYSYTIRKPEDDQTILWQLQDPIQLKENPTSEQLWTRYLGAEGREGILVVRGRESGIITLDGRATAFGFWIVKQMYGRPTSQVSGTGPTTFTVRFYQNGKTTDERIFTIPSDCFRGDAAQFVGFAPIGGPFDKIEIRDNLNHADTGDEYFARFYFAWENDVRTLKMRLSQITR